MWVKSAGRATDALHSLVQRQNSVARGLPPPDGFPMFAEFPIGPEDMEEIQYYDHYKMELKHSQYKKAQKLIELGCIKYNRDGQCFVCEPIPGYNKRTYQLKKRIDGTFTCNCQHMFSQEKKALNGVISPEDIGICSHIAALIMMFKDRAFVKP